VTQYLATSPDDAEAHIILGTLHAGAKQRDLAKAAFQRAVQLNPKIAQGYLQLGQAYQDLGETDSAIAQFAKALPLEPRSAVLHAMLGNLYLSKNNIDMARKRYEQALAIDPNFAAAVNNLAWLYAQHGGNLDVALSLAQKGKELFPDSPSTTDTLAWIQCKKGLYAAAIPLMQECVQKVPSSPTYHYHLGMALLAIGEKQIAKQHLQTALRLKLNQEDSRQVGEALAKLN